MYDVALSSVPAAIALFPLPAIAAAP
jgi:hypothetical protein